MSDTSPVTVLVHGITLYAVDPGIYYTPGAGDPNFYRLDLADTMYNKRDLSSREVQIAKALLKLALKELEELGE